MKRPPKVEIIRPVEATAAGAILHQVLVATLHLLTPVTFNICHIATVLAFLKGIINHKIRGYQFTKKNEIYYKKIESQRKYELHMMVNFL